MKEILKKLGSVKKHLKQTGDLEPEQAMIRVFVSMLLVTFFCLSWRAEEEFYELLTSTISFMALGYFILQWRLS